MYLTIIKECELSVVVSEFDSWSEGRGFEIIQKYSLKMVCKTMKGLLLVPS